MEIFKAKIIERFSNETIDFNRKLITINKKALDDLNNLEEYAALFNSLVENLTDKPPFLPFEGAEFAVENGPHLLVLGLDECQVILSVQ